MHEIFADRFVGQRQPAWHGLGTVFEDDKTAREAWELVGPYKVSTRTLRLAGKEKGLSQIEIPNRAIVRMPTEDDPEHRLFAVVGPEYEVVSPDIVVDAWDEFVKRPVETMGALGHGERFFVSTKTEAFDVQGDPVDNYILSYIPMDGLHAVTIADTPVRPVCQNTITAGIASAKALYRMRHEAGAKERFGAWLNDMVEQAAARAELMRDAFSILAKHQVESKQVDKVLAATYPLPREPRQDAPAAVMQSRFREWNVISDMQKRYREAASSLFLGDGTGMDLKSTKGTAYGLLQAIVETEDYRRGKDDAQISYDSLWGLRAENKKRAFDACLALVK